MEITLDTLPDLVISEIAMFLAHGDNAWESFVDTIRFKSTCQRIRRTISDNSWIWSGIGGDHLCDTVLIDQQFCDAFPDVMNGITEVHLDIYDKNELAPFIQILPKLSNLRVLSYTKGELPILSVFPESISYVDIHTISPFNFSAKIYPNITRIEYQEKFGEINWGKFPALNTLITFYAKDIDDLSKNSDSGLELTDLRVWDNTHVPCSHKQFHMLRSLDTVGCVGDWWDFTGNQKLEQVRISDHLSNGLEKHIGYNLPFVTDLDIDACSIEFTNNTLFTCKSLKNVTIVYNTTDSRKLQSHTFHPDCVLESFTGHITRFKDLNGVPTSITSLKGIKKGSRLLRKICDKFKSLKLIATADDKRPSSIPEHILWEYHACYEVIFWPI